MLRGFPRVLGMVEPLPLDVVMSLTVYQGIVEDGFHDVVRFLIFWVDWWCRGLERGVRRCWFQQGHMEYWMYPHWLG